MHKLLSGGINQELQGGFWGGVSTKNGALRTFVTFLVVFSSQQPLAAIM